MKLLFREAGGVTIPNPKNQFELVVWTLIFHNRNDELSMQTWMRQHFSHKWSTRLGQVEKRLDIELVRREMKKFVNIFGHDSEYTIYIPILEQSEYIALYQQLQDKSKKSK